MTGCLTQHEQEEICRGVSSECANIFSVSGCTIYCRQRRLHSDSYCCWFTAGSYDTGGKAAGMFNAYHATVSPARTISLLCVLCIAVVACKNNDQQLQ